MTDNALLAHTDSTATLWVTVVSVAIVLYLVVANLLSVTLYGREARPRDFAFMWLHITSLWFYAMQFATDLGVYGEGDYTTCFVLIQANYMSVYFMRTAVLVVYLMRFKVLIGPVYPRWMKPVSWIFSLAGLAYMSYSLTKLVIKKPVATSEPGQYTCNAEGVGETSFVCLAGLFFTKLLPTVIFLMLFIIPLIKSDRSDAGATSGTVFNKTIKRHLLLTIFAMLGDAAYFFFIFIAVELPTNKTPKKYDLTTGYVVYAVGVLLENLALQPIFTDWKHRVMPCVFGRGGRGFGAGSGDPLILPNYSATEADEAMSDSVPPDFRIRPVTNSRSLLKGIALQAGGFGTPTSGFTVGTPLATPSGADSYHARIRPTVNSAWGSVNG